jgi:hypothetical protein
MDPVVWGPKLWNVFFDVCYRFSVYHKAHGTFTKPQMSTLTEFFELFQFILPCSNCRESYQSHLEALPIREALESMQHHRKESEMQLCNHDLLCYPKTKTAKTGVWTPGKGHVGDLSRFDAAEKEHAYDLITWVHALKCRVNQKLKREPRVCLSLGLFRKRLNTWSSCASLQDLWDVLFIFTMNHPAHVRTGTEEEIEAKIDAYIRFFQLLPLVLEAVPHLEPCCDVFKQYPAWEKVRTRAELEKCLLEISEKMKQKHRIYIDFSLERVDLVEKRFENAKASSEAVQSYQETVKLPQK